MADEKKVETTETAQTETKAAETKTAETKTAETPALKYDDKMVNDIVAKNVAKETAKILALAGVKTPEELAALAKPKGDDPVKAELDALKKSQSEIQERADRNEAKAEALNAGVKKDALERVVKLAMSPAYDGTISERIGKVLAEVPEFVDKAAPSFGTETRKDAPDAVQELMNKARAAAGLPPIK